MDVPGQEERAYKREKICPISGPGLLKVSARKLKAKEIIEASGADRQQTLQASIASVSCPTFRHQSEIWLRAVKKRDVAPSTLSDWEGCLNTWPLPTTIDETPLGDLPLASIKRTVAQDLIDQMVADDLSAKTIERLREIKAEIVTLLQAEAAEAFLAAIQTIWPEARMLTPEEQAEDTQFRERLILLREANARVYATRTQWNRK